MKQQDKLGYSTLLQLLIMASITFVAILSEMLPSGLLTSMSEGLGVTEGATGQLVGMYALASAVTAVPLVTATMRWRRKSLLIFLLLLFSLSNVAVFFSGSYWLTFAMRIVGGVAAGVMWAMITAYGMKLVPKRHHGKAIAIIMMGNTLGVSLGMPFMAWLGELSSWRAPFLLLGVLAAMLMRTCFTFLPDVAGEQVNRANNPLALLRNKRVLVVLLLTLLVVGAHYMSYTYITKLVEELELRGGIVMALALFGVGSFISVLLAMKYTDTHLRLFTITTLALGAVSLALLHLFPHIEAVNGIAFFLWGVAFGPLVTILQVAVARQSSSAKAIATSVQSTVFNLSIMLATALGAVILGLPQGGAMALLLCSVLLLMPAVVVAAMATNTLGQN